MGQSQGAGHLTSRSKIDADVLEGAGVEPDHPSAKPEGASSAHAPHIDLLTHAGILSGCQARSRVADARSGPDEANEPPAPYELAGAI